MTLCRCGLKHFHSDLWPSKICSLALCRTVFLRFVCLCVRIKPSHKDSGRGWKDEMRRFHSGDGKFVNRSSERGEGGGGAFCLRLTAVSRAVMVLSIAINLISLCLHLWLLSEFWTELKVRANCRRDKSLSFVSALRLQIHPARLCLEFPQQVVRMYAWMKHSWFFLLGWAWLASSS